MKHLKLNISRKLAVLKSDLTAEKIILILLAFLLIAFKILHAYKVYSLANECLHVVGLITNTDIKIINLTFLGDFLVALYESKITLPKRNSVFRSVITGYKKFPTILLYSFLVVILYAFFTIPNFNLVKYLLIALFDYLIHLAVHILNHDKKDGWKKCKNLFYLFNLPKKIN